MKTIETQRIIAEINKIIDALKRNCTPDPMGSMEECLAAAEIETLEMVKEIIETLPNCN